MRIQIVCGLIAAAMAGCGGAAGLAGGGGIGAECRTDFGETGPAKTLETFMTASTQFIETAAALEGDLVGACKAMGTELGVPAAEMEPTGGTPAARAACAPVAAKIQAELTDLRASASLQITVAATPPVCEVKVDAYARCAGECDVNVDPGQVDIQCEGGELRGGCSGECTGSCSAQVTGQCSGACEGTCQAGCTGTCNGRCDGTCAARGPNGECNGACQGTCHGTCSAGCSGSCEGSCVAQAQASCQGECRGSCSVEFTEPRCTGTVRPPSMSAECQASCDASLQAEAECRPGSLTVNIEGTVAENFSERIGRLKNALESGMPAIQSIAAKLERLGSSGATIVETTVQLPNAVAELGANAVMCATAAVGALPQATASVSVSIEVSASVSASAG